MAIGWGLLGTGAFAGLRAAPAIAADDGSVLAAVASREALRAKTFAAEHGALAAHGSLAELLADPAVDVVYVTTPNALHAEQALLALRAGKHVLVEKPLTLTTRSALELRDAALAAGRSLGVGFHLRHKAANARARDLVRGGALGPVVSAHVAVGAGKTGYPYDTWRADPRLAGGGTVVNQGAHAVDLLRFVTGEEVLSVSATTDAPQLEDVFAATCQLSGGGVATVASHQVLAGGPADYVVIGRGGWLHSRGGTSPFSADLVTARTDSGPEQWEEPGGDAYAVQVAAFRRAVEGRAPVVGDALDGLRGVEVLEAVARSVREGRSAPVQLSAA